MAGGAVMAIAQVVGHRIKVKRIDLKMSQTNLAIALGISQSHMSNIEKGNRLITLDMLEATAKVLKCPLVDLLGEQAKRAA